jgi:hypothetical protein
MKKILTIAATAGLLSAFTGAVSAQTTFSTAVDSSCTVTSPATVGLAPNALPPSSLTGSTVATVICNDTTKSLNVGIGATSVVFNGTPSVVLAGGTGNFVGATGLSKTITTTTGVGGDTATVNAAITAPAGKLLATGSYTLIMNPTITP